jgi:formylglycine-generating enzyme required for sulfatase activity
MERITFLVLIALFLTTGADAQRKRPQKVRAYNQNSLPAPAGMVYVPGGSIVIKYGADSAGVKKYSLSPFFIDKTEVTNRQYREFLNWVIDSVLITQYVQDDGYFKDDFRDSSHKYINWSKVNHDKLLKNNQSTIAQLLDNGRIRPELYNFTLSYTRSGHQGKHDIVKETVNVYPDVNVWSKDFPNSQTDMIMKDYFTNSAFDDYPVVGVTWKQARAYAYWRTMVARDDAGGFLAQYNLPYSLPSEAQWVYAAQGMANSQDSLVSLRDSKNRLNANFKQEEGDYTQDGSSYTVPVMAYAPNELGIYNLLGNVSEWVLDAYNASAWAFVHDQNPVLLYDAEQTDSDLMRSKIVRGGSWKDNAQFLSPYTRNYEVQDIPHSYIGFRLVMPAPEILGTKVETRRR